MGKSMRGLLWLNNVGIPNLNHQQSPKKNDIFFYVIKNKNECKSGEREKEKRHTTFYIIVIYQGRFYSRKASVMTEIPLHIQLRRISLTQLLYQFLKK